MNVTELVARVRQIIGEIPQSPTQPLHWSDEELLSHINSGYESLWHKASLADENWGIDFLTLQELGATQAALSGLMVGIVLPEEIGQIVYVEENVDANSSGWEVPPTTIRAMWRSKASVWPYFDPLRRGWIHAASQGGMIFTKTDQPLDLTKTRVWFKRRAPRLVRFTASGPSSQVLRVNMLTGVLLGSLARAKDYYKNTLLQCITGNPAGTSPQGLSSLIAGYALQSHPNFDFSTGFPHGAPAGNTVWETLPLFPESHHELLAQLGAYRAFSKGADQAQKVMVGQDVAALFDDFVQMAEQRQVQYPRTVNYEEP